MKISDTLPADLEACPVCGGKITPAFDQVDGYVTGIQISCDEAQCVTMEKIAPREGQDTVVAALTKQEILSYIETWNTTAQRTVRKIMELRNEDSAASAN